MTYEPNNNELSLLNSGRMMRAESDVIMPMLNKQREDAVAGICNSFRSGKLEMLPVFAAQLVSIENMRTEIKHKIAKAENIERKIYDNGNT